jgi:hypothetical protein
MSVNLVENISLIKSQDFTSVGIFFRNIFLIEINIFHLSIILNVFTALRCEYFSFMYV